MEEWSLATQGAIHWPTAIAAILLGVIVARRFGSILGARAGLLVGLCLFGGLTLIDRSAAVGLDLITGLGVVAALDRILGRGSDWQSGLWAAVAVLSGGWPALLMIVLPVVVLGRQGSYLSWGLLVPPLIAFAAWSAWALSVAPGVVWGEALVVPLRQPPSWTLALWVVGYGLPWTPLALLALWPSVRQGWSESGRALVKGWLQVSGVAVLAGTLIPGLGTTAWLPALVGLAVAASAALDRLWVDGSLTGPRRMLFGLSIVMALLVAAVVVPMGTYLAAALPYYQVVLILLVFLAISTAAVAVVGAWNGKSRWAIGVFVALSLGLKIAHAGFYVPEWNYRVGQGAWGRAIGQWVPPRWPIFTFQPWPAELAFATEHPFRQLVNPKLLTYYLDPTQPRFVLLSQTDFEHWPKEAPKLLKVHSFEDARGEIRVLARTEGKLFVRANRDGDLERK